LKNRILSVVGFVVLVLLGSQVPHLQVTDPYAPAPIFYGAQMTPQEKESSPQKAVSLTPSALKEMYGFMAQVQQILEAHKIPYWATYGTLLGTIRDKGIIPWDDDFDLSCFQSDTPKLLNLKTEFEHEGLVIEETKTTIRIYKKEGLKMRPRQGKAFQIFPGLWYVRHKHERFPCVDIYPVQLEGTRYQHANKAIRQDYPKHFYDKDDLLPLEQKPFGPIGMMVPHQADNVLNRMYGTTWAQERVIYKSHLSS